MVLCGVSTTPACLERSLGTTVYSPLSTNHSRSFGALAPPAISFVICICKSFSRKPFRFRTLQTLAASEFVSHLQCAHYKLLRKRGEGEARNSSHVTHHPSLSTGFSSYLETITSETGPSKPSFYYHIRRVPGGGGIPLVLHLSVSISNLKPQTSKLACRMGPRPPRPEINRD